MVKDIYVPPISQTMDTLLLVEWVKEIGDEVEKGETLYLVETDKATMEVEAPTTGVLKSKLAEPGEEIKVRSIIGTIAEPGEAWEEEAPAAPPTTPEPAPAGPRPARAAGGNGQKPERPAERLFASPRARRLAERKGVDLARVSGSGPQDAIVERDVVAFLEQQPGITPVARRMAREAGLDLAEVSPAAPGQKIRKADIEAELEKRQPSVASTAAPTAEGAVRPEPATAAPGLIPVGGRVVELSRTRQTIARRMSESDEVTAPVTYMREVDATRLVELRRRILDMIPDDSVRPTYTDLLVAITARVLRKQPALNSTFDGETWRQFDEVHMSLAVDTERGLIVPIIRNAHTLGVGELARARRKLVEQVREGSVSPDALQGGTFTITNLGTMGVDFFTPIVNPPQVAILAVGRIREVPAVHEGEIVVRHVLGLGLTADHRVIDGAPAGRFLNEVARIVEEPDLIWL